MTKKYFISLVLLFLGSCDLFSPSYYNLKSVYTDLVIENDSLDFNPSLWLEDNPVVKGKMLASLLRTHNFLEMTNKDVFKLLGESQCYYHYEDEPCYILQYGEELYKLGFGVNHSDNPGKISSVLLFK